MEKHHFISRNRYGLAKVSKDWMEVGHFEVLRALAQGTTLVSSRQEQGTGKWDFKLSPSLKLMDICNRSEPCLISFFRKRNLNP